MTKKTTETYVQKLHAMHQQYPEQKTRKQRVLTSNPSSPALYDLARTLSCTALRLKMSWGGRTDDQGHMDEKAVQIIAKEPTEWLSQLL